MHYENRQPPEGINVSDEHPLKEFAQLVIGITLVGLIAITVLSYLAGYFARYIPFSYEQSMVQNTEFLLLEESAQQQELQDLADRLTQHMDLPADMEITVHHNDQSTINALATLGGNIIVFEGLRQELDTEQELAAVLAHEIAHVKLRHPIVATGKGLTLMTLVATLSGASASTASDWLLGSAINVSMMQYSRSQELAADALAAAALYREYGDIAGAKALFARFAELESANANNMLSAEAFRSHPYSENRWLALQELALKHGWPTTSAQPK